MKPALLFALLLLAAIASTASAQGGSCDIESRSPATQAKVIGSANYVSGPATYRCTGGVVVDADSAMYAFGRLVLVRRITYSDPEKLLTGAQRLEYEGRTGVVVATGDVTLTDKVNGSILRAPQGLTYNKATASNPEARIQIFSGRPRATLFSRDSAGGQDTTIVDSDRMELVGERLFRGWGAVVVDRGDLDAQGAFVEYDQGNRLVINGNGQVRTPGINLWGDSIYGALTPNDEFTEVNAFRNSRLEAKELTVLSSRLRIALDTGVVQRLIAVSDTVPGEAFKQAFAAAEGFELTADSIDALAPAQRVETVTAVGHARGVRMADSVDMSLPQLIQHDWVAGDTVVAQFVDLPDSIIQRNRAAGDSANDRTLDRLTALGAPASSLYRHYEEGDTTATPAANYLTARRIVVHMVNGEVKEVNADGDLKGIYLEPVNRATETQPDTGQSGQTGQTGQNPSTRPSGNNVQNNSTGAAGVNRDRSQAGRTGRNQSQPARSAGPRENTSR